MSDLARLVETLYVLRGYTPEPAPGGHILRFRKGKDHLAIRVREGRDPLPAFVAHEVAETLPALGHAMLVCLGDLGHEARGILERGGIDVWTREKLIHEVGKALLEAAEQHRLGEAFPAAPPATPEPAPSVDDATLVIAAPPAVAPAPPPEPPAMPLLREESAAAPALLQEPAPEPAPAPRLPPVVAAPAPPPAPAAPSLWARLGDAKPAPPPAIPLTPTLVQVAPAPAAAPAPPPVAPTPAPPASAPATAAAEGTVLATAVDRDHALRVGVGRLLRVDKVALELVPLHAFRYACKLEAKGAPAIPKHGLLAVDAVTGAVREMAEPLFGALPGPAERLQALLPELDAVPLVKQKVVEQHTQKIRVKNSLGRNSLIVEDKVVRPDARTMQLDHLGLWWLPVWRLEGQNGALRVNAATGAVEDEKLKRAFAQDAEFL